MPAHPVSVSVATVVVAPCSFKPLTRGYPETRQVVEPVLWNRKMPIVCPVRPVHGLLVIARCAGVQAAGVDGDDEVWEDDVEVCEEGSEVWEEGFVVWEDGVEGWFGDEFGTPAGGVLPGGGVDGCGATGVEVRAVPGPTVLGTPLVSPKAANAAVPMTAAPTAARAIDPTVRLFR